MDDVDKIIINELQKNCKITTKKLARKLNLPISTVFTRIKNLERQGIIKEYKAILDAKKLNKSTTAFILLSYDPSYKISQEKVAKKLSLIPNVQEVHIITGEWDILIKIKSENVEELGRIILNKIREIEGIEKSYSLIVLKTIKETTEIQI
ncbi:MAG: Lrp/AsnC family transcriptional regulator [Candidatus Aenigmatarchaeota archaeon]